jgi:molecular chaperone GrpE (heat shock protein)
MTDEIESLRRWLREQEDEIARLKAEVTHYRRIAETRHFEDAQHDAINAKAQAYFAALAALVEHLQPGRSLTDMERWDAPWPQVVEALRQ